MFICEVCKKEFENLNLLQRHFGFKNSKEPRHQIFKANQVILAEEIFITDKSGDTFHILKNHPEINLISEKALRLIWINKYGKDGVEKRRVEIGNNKRVETIYQPRKEKREVGFDKQCPVCDFKYAGNTTFSHHVCAMKDDIHKDLVEQQRQIAIKLFHNDREHNTFEIIELNPEFVLSESVLRNKFWAEEFSVKERNDRRNEISGKSRIGILPWNNGLTKENSNGLVKMSKTRTAQCVGGIPYLNTPENAAKLKLAYAEGRRKPNVFSPEQKSQIALKLRQGHLDGSIKTPHGKGGYRQDLTHYVRSTWEANFSRILNHLNIPYEYEPDVFPLMGEDGSLIDTYTPDFKLKGRYYEIKGVFKSASDWSGVHANFQGNIDKINLFRAQYPNIKLRIIGKKEYLKLINSFKHKLIFE
jgi:hypothetical protein